MEGNLETMSNLPRIRSQLKGSIQGMPMLLGPSRKGFLGKLTGNLAACTCSHPDCYACLFSTASLCHQMCLILQSYMLSLNFCVLDQQPTGTLFNANSYSVSSVSPPWGLLACGLIFAFFCLCNFACAFLTRTGKSPDILWSPT